MLLVPFQSTSSRLIMVNEIIRVIHTYISFHINYQKLSPITTMFWRSPSPHLWYPVLTKEILAILRITMNYNILHINRLNYTSIDRITHQSFELHINRLNYTSIVWITHQSFKLHINRLNYTWITHQLIELQCILRGTWSTYYGTALCLLIVSWNHVEIKILHQYKLNHQFLFHPSNFNCLK